MAQEQNDASEIEKIEEQQLEPETAARNIVGLVDLLLGDRTYEGEAPFTIQVIDNIDKTAYVIDIRRGEDSQRNRSWITIQQRVINNPYLTESYLLEKKAGGEWQYIDPYLIKYDSSSVPKLQTVHSRLDRARQALIPKELPDVSPNTKA